MAAFSAHVASGAVQENDRRSNDGISMGRIFSAPYFGLTFGLCHVFVVLTLLLSGCRGDPLGRSCKEDTECGPGFDCFTSICVQVCTSDDECGSAQTCYRYHCIDPVAQGFGRSRETNSRGQVARRAQSNTPPVPDVIIIELRALRQQIELLRKEVGALREIHGDGLAPGPKFQPPVVKLPPPPSVLPDNRDGHQ